MKRAASNDNYLTKIVKLIETKGEELTKLAVERFEDEFVTDSNLKSFGILLNSLTQEDLPKVEEPEPVEEEVDENDESKEEVVEEEKKEEAVEEEKKEEEPKE
ncbi:hypothetical protein GEMRC1_009146 [Eukaryota sp. GEM-RC1]